MSSQQTESTAPISRTLPAPGGYLCGLTWDGTVLWHSDQEEGKVYAVDRETGAVRTELNCPRARADLAFDGNHVCQVGGRPKRVLVLDRATGDVVEERAVRPSSGRLTGIEFGPEGLWMCLRGPTVVQLRDYETMTVQREYPVEGDSPSGLTYVGGAVVHGDFGDAVLRATDAATGRSLGSVTVTRRPSGLTWDGEQLWYCDFPARSFRALDTEALPAGFPR
jgi:hypothetical protein